MVSFIKAVFLVVGQGERSPTGGITHDGAEIGNENLNAVELGGYSLLKFLGFCQRISVHHRYMNRLRISYMISHYPEHLFNPTLFSPGGSGEVNTPVGAGQNGLNRKHRAYFRGNSGHPAGSIGMTDSFRKTDKFYPSPNLLSYGNDFIKRLAFSSRPSRCQSDKAFSSRHSFAIEDFDNSLRRFLLEYFFSILGTGVEHAQFR